MLFSFSAIVQRTPCPPIGFSILKAGLNKSVLLSVYTSSNVRDIDGSRYHGTITSFEVKLLTFAILFNFLFLEVYLTSEFGNLKNIHL